MSVSNFLSFPFSVTYTNSHTLKHTDAKKIVFFFSLIFKIEFDCGVQILYLFEKRFDLVLNGFHVSNILHMMNSFSRYWDAVENKLLLVHGNDLLQEKPSVLLSGDVINLLVKPTHIPHMSLGIVMLRKIIEAPTCLQVHTLCHPD
jgi:hypothetical protein